MLNSLVRCLSSQFGKARRARLRSDMRSHRLYGLTGAPYRQHAMAGQLVQVPLELPSNAWQGLLPPAVHDAATICLKQRLLDLSMAGRLLALLTAHCARPGTSIPCALPEVWWRWLSRQGVARDQVASRIVWQGEQIRGWAKGFRCLLALTKSAWQPAETPPAALLVNVAANAAISGDGIRSYVSWFRRTLLPSDGKDKVWVHCQNRSGATELPSPFQLRASPLPGLSAVNRWAFWRDAIAALICGIMRWLCGGWWVPLIIDEVLLYLYARHIGQWAPIIAFDNSSYIFRPLWTHRAEACGAQVMMVFYATNTKLFAPAPEWGPPISGYLTMNWPHYVVWNSEQAAWLRGMHPQASISMVGEVDFVDSNAPPPQLSPGTIAVFDVAPLRPSHAAQRGLYQPFYTAETVIRFFDDILAAAADAGLEVAIKAKRNANIMHASAYRRWLGAFKGTLVTPDIAPARWIGQVAGAVSLPFTSTASIAHNAGVPSVFYDPTGKVPTPDNGIPVLRGREQLVEWMAVLSRSLPRE